MVDNMMIFLKGTKWKDTVMCSAPRPVVNVIYLLKQQKCAYLLLTRIQNLA